MPKKRWNTKGIVMKLDPELKKVINEIKRNNQLKSDRDASLNLARAYNFKIKGQKMTIREDIVF